MSARRPADPLEDAWRRLNWANRHGKALQGVVSQYRETGPYGFLTKPQGDRWEVTFRRLIEPGDEAEWFDRIANLFGAFLDGSRAALNYVAYQIALLALRENPSLADPALPRRRQVVPERAEFPIFNDPANFNDKGIKNFPTEFRDAFIKVQPYDGNRPGLWMLHELAAKYRHRIIHPIAMLPFDEHHGVAVNGARIADADIEVVHDGGPLKDGDAVLRFSVDAEPGANVHPIVAISPGIDDPVCAGMQLIVIANTISEDVGRVINAFELEFFGSMAHVEERPGGPVFVVDGPVRGRHPTPPSRT